MKERMKELRPAEVSPPGRLIQRELDARGWSQSDLAAIMGRTDAVVSEIIHAKRGITPETARGLADAFGTSAELWLNREASYRLSLLHDDDIVSRRARLYEKAPIREMINRHWLEDTNNIDVLEQQVLDFLAIGSLDDEPTFPHAARKSTPYDAPPTAAQQAWLCRARQLAPAVAVQGSYSQRRTPLLIQELHDLAEAPESIRLVPRILAKYGIRLMILQPLEGTKIDGASFLLGASPVIVLSLRYDRIDHFWHTLMHELAHIRFEDGPLLDLEIVTDKAIPKADRPEYEWRADEFASNSLVPTEKLEDFIIRVRPLFSAKRIQAFARTMEVHAGIVVGQLQHRNEIGYQNLRKMLVPVRHIITGTTLTDGWGSQLPASF
jgi:HTH-type transcriptional regulator/antitoxin HigA